MEGQSDRNVKLKSHGSIMEMNVTHASSFLIGPLDTCVFMQKSVHVNSFLRGLRDACSHATTVRISAFLTGLHDTCVLMQTSVRVSNFVLAASSSRQ